MLGLILGCGDKPPEPLKNSCTRHVKNLSLHTLDVEADMKPTHLFDLYLDEAEKELKHYKNCYDFIATENIASHMLYSITTIYNMYKLQDDEPVPENIQPETREHIKESSAYFANAAIKNIDFLLQEHGVVLFNTSPWLYDLIQLQSDIFKTFPGRVFFYKNQIILCKSEKSQIRVLKHFGYLEEYKHCCSQNSYRGTQPKDIFASNVLSTLQKVDRALHKFCPANIQSLLKLKKIHANITTSDAFQSYFNDKIAPKMITQRINYFLNCYSHVGLSKERIEFGERVGPIYAKLFLFFKSFVQQKSKRLVFPSEDDFLSPVFSNDVWTELEVHYKTLQACLSHTTANYKKLLELFRY